MTNPTHLQQEVTRVRLLAAALALQHQTGTAANVIPIPGGDRVIVIGTPAEVARALPMATPRAIPDAECAQGRCARRTTGCSNECGMKAVARRVAHQATIGCGLSVAPADQVDSEGGHHD